MEAMRDQQDDADDEGADQFRAEADQRRPRKGLRAGVVDEHRDDDQRDRAQHGGGTVARKPSMMAM